MQISFYHKVESRPSKATQAHGGKSLDNSRDYDQGDYDGDENDSKGSGGNGRPLDSRHHHHVHVHPTKAKHNNDSKKANPPDIKIKPTGGGGDGGGKKEDESTCAKPTGNPKKQQSSEGESRVWPWGNPDAYDREFPEEVCRWHHDNPIQCLPNEDVRKRWLDRRTPRVFCEHCNNGVPQMCQGAFRKINFLHCEDCEARCYGKYPKAVPTTTSTSTTTTTTTTTTSTPTTSSPATTSTTTTTTTTTTPAPTTAVPGPDQPPTKRATMDDDDDGAD